MKFPATILCVICALAAVPGMAEQTEKQSGPTLEQIAQLFFRQYDGNGDGMVTRREFLTPSMAQFDYLDRNADGAVDMQEVSDFTRMMTERQNQR